MGPTPTLRLWDVGPLRPRVDAGVRLRLARRLQLALSCQTVSERRVVRQCGMAWYGAGRQVGRIKGLGSCAHRLQLPLSPIGE